MHNNIIKSTVKIHGKDPEGNCIPLGTGFFIHPQGYLLTCFHVVQDIDNLYIVWDSDWQRTSIWKVYEELDIAVLKVQMTAENWVPLKQRWHLNEKVFIYGFQDIQQFDGVSLSGEIVGPVHMGREPNKKTLIKMKGLDIQKGMSGAGVLSVKSGEVIGIVTSAFPSRKVGFAIPSNDILAQWEWIKTEYKELIAKNEKMAFRERVINYFKIANYSVQIDVPVRNGTYHADIILTIKEPALGAFTKIFVKCLYLKSEEQCDNIMLNDVHIIGDICKTELNVNHVIIVSNKSLSSEFSHPANSAGITYRTLKDIENNIINFDAYLENLIKNFREDRLSDYFVDLKVQYQVSETVETKYLGEIINDNWFKRTDRENSLVMILGEYGTGKTSYCRKIACDFACKYSKKPSKYRIPILFNLKPYRKDFDMDDIIITTLVKNYNVPISDLKAFKEMNKTDSFVLIFDGFNEMAQRLTQEEAVENFRQLSTTFTENAKVIITCRTEYLEMFKSMKHEISNHTLKHSILRPKLQLLYFKEFGVKEIKNYLKNRDLDNWEKYWEFIKKSSYLYELSRRPLFIDMISSIIPKLQNEIESKRRKNINMGELMGYYIDEAFSKWDKYEEVPDNLTRKEKQLLLNEIAYYLIERDIQAIGYPGIQGLIQTYIPEMNELIRNSSTINNRKRSVEKIDIYCRDLLSRSFLSGQNNTEFSHSCLMYYFAAQKFFKAIENRHSEVFDITFVGAETILLVKDFILLSGNEINKHCQELCNWLRMKNYNIQKYATLFIGFIGDRQTADMMKVTIENMYGEISLPKKLKAFFYTPEDHIDHLKLHTLIALSQLGLVEYKIELDKILKEDPDYTHRCYALLGVEQICSRNKDLFTFFVDALKKIISDTDEKPELKRLSEKIIKLNSRRVHTRYPVNNKKINILYNNEIHEAQLINISRGGALILPQNFRKMDDTFFQFIFDPNTRLDAEITHFKNPFVHLKFLTEINNWNSIQSELQLSI